MRTSAVVRCASCQKKYRIKSNHVERVLETGPRTLSEGETLLRTDSVDIDPSEASPVSIDDDGNVVGLSGLSELMRQGDARGTKDKLKARAEDTTSNYGKTSRDSDAALRLPDNPANPQSAARRQRLLAKRKRHRTNLALVLSLVLLLLVSGGVLLFIVTGAGKGKAGSGESATKNGQPAPDNTGDPSDTTNQAQKPPGTSNDPGPGESGKPPKNVAPSLFAGIGEHRPNPKVKFVPPWSRADPDALPADVPTVLTPAKAVVYEGWYITSPPRGSAQAVGEPDIDISELSPREVSEELTVLSGSVTNRTSRALLAGEMHVMLLDSSGRVFAETYLPLVMLGADAEQAVSLPIATRHWKKVRGVRTSVKALRWREALSPIAGVSLQPVGEGENTAVRVSARYQGEAPLRDVIIQLEARDSAGGLLRRFVVQNEQIHVAPGGWLDLVVQTPLPQDSTAEQWSAVVQAD